MVSRIAATGLVASLLLLMAWMVAAPNVPDFSSLPADGTRQRAFADTLCPIIEQVNSEIRAQREEIVAYGEAGALDRRQGTTSIRLLELAEEYGLSTDVAEAILHQRLLSRVGELPPDLVIAQAALESGWGTSAIAKAANNLFGRRCFYVDDCYELVGVRGEVTRYRSFKSFEAAVRLYFRDLNVLKPYRGLRAARSVHGQNAHALAGGLSAYSSRGEAYARHVRTMLNSNAGLCAASGKPPQPGD